MNWPEDFTLNQRRRMVCGLCHTGADPDGRPGSDSAGVSKQKDMVQLSDVLDLYSGLECDTGYHVPVRTL